VRRVHRADRWIASCPTSGEWLRRQRRINDAKPVLGAALETFRRLGAAPWTRRAEPEMRACGVTAQAWPGPPRARWTGSPHQLRDLIDQPDTPRATG
jgi:hypothetical protein